MKTVASSLLGITLVISGVTSARQDSVKNEMSQAEGVVWALNVGGQAYQSLDGVIFQKDPSDITESVATVNASQDSTVFQTFRSGDLKFDIPLQNDRYAITLNFVEPLDTPVGKRLFNIIVEGQVMERDFDVRRARDGNALSALTHTLVDLEVQDGELNLELQGVKGKPVLSGVVVRRHIPPSSDWQLIWSDEFDYRGAPDPDKWTHEIWPAGKVNREDQRYTDSLDNVRVENGSLVIEAHKTENDEAQYSSGRIHSSGKGDFLYGRVDIRAKLPAGQGTWAALWMMPSNPFKYASNCSTHEEWHGNDSCDAWPNSGEIDIMEHVGYDMNRVHGTVHNKAYYWVNGKQRKASVNAQDVAEDFHLYSLQWSPERIDVYFENVPYFTYLNQGEGWQAWPFDHPYHVILNLAIGGDWGRAGGPIDNTIFPAKMEVDYVRIYQKLSPGGEQHVDMGKFPE